MYMVMNMAAKLISEAHTPVEAVFYRNAGAFACVLFFMAATRQWGKIKTNNLKGQIVRAIIGNIGLFMTFTAFAMLPVADATAIIFTAPLFVVLLSMPVLGERVGPYRMLGTVFGFCGLLFILQPGSGEWNLGIAAALGAGVANAVVSVTLRQLGKTDEPLTTVFYFMLIGCLLTGVVMPFVFTMPSGDEISLIPLIGVAGFLMQFSNTYSYRFGEATMVAPLIYTRFIWAVLFGVLFLGEWPDIMVWTGAAIIIVSNLFILWREQRQKQDIKPV